MTYKMLSNSVVNVFCKLKIVNSASIAWITCSKISSQFPLQFKRFPSISKNFISFFWKVLCQTYQNLLHSTELNSLLILKFSNPAIITWGKVIKATYDGLLDRSQCVHFTHAIILKTYINNQEGYKFLVLGNKYCLGWS